MGKKELAGMRGTCQDEDGFIMSEDFVHGAWNFWEHADEWAHDAQRALLRLLLSSERELQNC